MLYKAELDFKDEELPPPSSGTLGPRLADIFANRIHYLNTSPSVNYCIQAAG